MGVLFPFPVAIARKRVAFPVVPQVVRVIEVRVFLMQITEKLVKPLPVRHARRRRFPQAPFSEQAGGIPGLAQHLRQRDVLVAQRDAAAIAPHGRVARVVAGHQHAARRRALRTSRVRLGEPHPVARQTVQMRRPDALLAVAAEMAIPQVVGVDQDNVRLWRRE